MKLGMNWATLANTPFRRYKHFTHEGGISTPLIAHWPAGIPAAGTTPWKTSRRTSIDVMATAVDVDRRRISARVQGPGHRADARRQPAARVRRRAARPDAADLLGARRQSRDSLGQVEARVAVPGWSGSSTT